MILLAIYVAKVILISGLFLGYYTLALRNERFHEWNRHYLVFSVIASFVIPFFHWPALASQYFVKEPVYVAQIQTFTFNVKSGTESISWIQWLGILYALVALAFIIGLIMALGKIYFRIKLGKKKQFPRFTLVINAKTISPFSFFRYVFWSNKISVASREGRHILRHELAHVREKHSIDKLFLEIVIAIFWVNPFFYFMRRELHLIHEFLADKKACENNEPREYATLLVEQALCPGNMMLTSSFFQKQLSRRVHMLIREHKDHFTYLKRLMAIPVTLMVVCFFLFLQSHATNKKEVVTNKIHTTALQPFSAPTKSVLHTPIPTVNQNGIDKPVSKDLTKEKASVSVGNESGPHKVFTFVQQMPSFRGGESALMTYLHNNIRYPAAARENGLQGTVVVQFIVNTDGSLIDIKTIGSKKGGGLEQEAIRVIKAMPRWTPGSQDGRPVNVQYNLPVRFVLGNRTASGSAWQLQPPTPPASTFNAGTSLSNGTHDKIFTFVEQMPTFPGGEGALMHYLSAHIHYPAAARKNGIQGTVVIRFVLNTDGTMQDVHSVGSKKGGGLEEEAIRVLKNMPPWNPGRQDGKPVDVQYNLPIRFVLQ